MKNKILIWCLFFSITGFSQNILLNGDFGSGLSSWTPFNANWIPVNANFNAINNEANITGITGAGGATWHVQLNQILTSGQIGQLTVGNSYTLSFDARSNGPRSLRTYVGQEGGGFVALNITDHNITSTMSTYNVTFTVTQTFSAMKVGFEMGLSNNPVFIDNVSLTQFVGPVAPAQPVGLVANNTVGGTPVAGGAAFLACGPNNVGGNIIYRLFYAPTASAPVDPTTASEYNFGDTPGDGAGSAAFGFTITGLTASTNYTFWLYQYNLSNNLFSTPASASVVTGSGILPATRNITFRVDMSQYVGAFTTPHVSGTFNGWSGTSNPMTNTGNNIWETTIALVDGNYQYKFSHDNWTGEESLTPGIPCTTTGGGFTNRTLAVSADATLNTVCWNSCSGCNTPAVLRDVTFRVDMSQFSGTFTTPAVNGTFNNWCGACNSMTNIGNNVWEVTVQLEDGNYEYKFTHDGWTGQENLTPGSACTLTTGPNTNRTLTVSANVALPTVCWNSCSACGVATPPAQPVGFVASNSVGPNPVGAGQAFLACGPNNVGSGNIVYRLFYAPTASAPSNPLTATQHSFGTIAGDGNGISAFGFVITDLTPATPYTFWLYQYNTVTELYSAAAIATATSGAGSVGTPGQPAGFVALNSVGGAPINTTSQVFLACGPNAVGGNIAYALYYYPSEAITIGFDPINDAFEYNFGSTPGDGNGTSAFGFVMSNLDDDTDYTFYLYQYNTVSNLYSSPAIANYTTTAITTQLRPQDCGATNVTVNQMLRAIEFNAPVYRFKVVGGNNGGAGWNNGEYIYDSPHRGFRFTNIPGSFWGQTYLVSVAMGNGSGSFGPYGTACAVTLANAIPTTSLQASSCNVNIQPSQDIFATMIQGATAYRFRINGTTQVVVSEDRKIKMSEFGNIVWGQTYSVDVAVQSAGGDWGNYGSACNVTVSPTTQLQSSQCGITNVMPTTNLFANSVIGATSYRFKITGANIGGAGWSGNMFFLDRPNRSMNFSMVPGFIPGEQYTIEVAVSNDGTNFMNYSIPCTVTIFLNPLMEIDNSEIMLTNKTLATSEFAVNASQNPFTTDFGIQMVNANDSEAVQVVIYDMSGKVIENNTVNPMDIESTRFGMNLAPGMYMVTVIQGSNQAVIRQVKN